MIRMEFIDAALEELAGVVTRDELKTRFGSEFSEYVKQKYFFLSLASHILGNVSFSNVEETVFRDGYSIDEFRAFVKAWNARPR